VSKRRRPARFDKRLWRRSNPSADARQAPLRTLFFSFPNHRAPEPFAATTAAPVGRSRRSFRSLALRTR
jgi:hypothetical protein